MAAPNSSKVSAGKPNATGAIYAAPITTTAPTDATTALDAAFVPLGYVSDGGLTNAVSTETSDTKAWGGDTVMRSLTGRDETFSWSFIHSLDEDVIKEVYGQANVTVASDGAITVAKNGLAMPRRVFVFEMSLTGGRVKRIVVPEAQITEVGDVVYNDGDPIGYDVTLTAYPDDEGNTSYEYITGTGTPAVPEG